MLNYSTEATLLLPHIPKGTELDLFEGQTYISLVGFEFLDTRILGMPVPWHRNFEEVNLRFYVRRVIGGEVRRGVCFIREIVPRWAISAAARLIYNENYRSLPMTHRIELRGDTVTAEYAWRAGRRWNRLRARAAGAPRPAVEGSLEQFISEHYWGYCRQRDGSSIEYRVEHPSWLLWPECEAGFEGDAAALYGTEFAAVLRGRPMSALAAQGSKVSVLMPVRVD